MPLVRGPGCLINLVEDATDTTLAWFSEEETAWVVADVLRAWVQNLYRLDSR
jgi:hypothetical protein